MIKYDFSVYSLGCKVNQYEGQSLVEKLISSGFTAIDSLCYANNYIINTCSVTSEADRKSRQTIARVLKINPSARIYVSGCSSQNETKPFLSKPNVVMVSGTSGKMKFLDLIIEDVNRISNNNSNFDLDAVPSKSIKSSKDSVFELSKAYEDDLTPILTKTRGNIKIQDGCNNYCTYCIVPYLRGASRSRDIESIFNEAKMLSNDTSEIVLSGINISDYKCEGGGLTELVKKLGSIKARKRISSLECNIISKDLLLAMKDSGFCDHFHLSMQSGCDSVLKRMNRHYTSAEFLHKIELIRSFFPNSGITSDIIVGFAEETDDEFNQTVETVKKAEFSDIHIFPYSERKGTKAANLPQVDKSIRIERANFLNQIKIQSRQSFLKSQIGRVLEVFVEESDGDYNCGFTTNYLKVYTKADIKSLKNHTVTDIYKNGLKGVVYE